MEAVEAVEAVVAVVAVEAVLARNAGGRRGTAGSVRCRVARPCACSCSCNSLRCCRHCCLPSRCTVMRHSRAAGLGLYERKWPSP